MDRRIAVVIGTVDTGDSGRFRRPVAILVSTGAVWEPRVGGGRLGTAARRARRGHMFSPVGPGVSHSLIPSLCVPIVTPLMRLPALVPHRARAVTAGGALSPTRPAPPAPRGTRPPAPPPPPPG